MAGRVWVSAQERESETIQAYADGLLEHGGTIVDPDELRRRVGQSLVGRATGPFRNQVSGWRERTLTRVALAERWVAEQLS